jgi:quercetin dioxygenase-like cupin family protein
MAGAPRRGVKIFRAADSVDLQKTDFMEPPTMSEATRSSIMDVVAAGSLDGGDVRVLNRCTDESGGFSLVHVWFKAGYPLPRHSHDSDCMYYVISGEAHLGKQVLRAGDSFFVPADAPYTYAPGPDGVEILEIRKDCERFDMQIPDAPAARWESMVASSAEHHERWTSERTSPTFAANEG